MDLEYSLESGNNLVEPEIKEAKDLGFMIDLVHVARTFKNSLRQKSGGLNSQLLASKKNTGPAILLFVQDRTNFFPQSHPEL